MILDFVFDQPKCGRVTFGCGFTQIKNPLAAECDVDAHDVAQRKRLPQDEEPKHTEQRLLAEERHGWW